MLMRLSLVGSLLASAMTLLPSCKSLDRQSAAAPKGSVDLKGQAERQEFIKTARIWSSPEVAIEGQDLTRPGPRCRDFAPDDIVTCKFAPPKRDGGGAGWTPKFKCVDATGRSLKVKYGRTNAEVYHEPFTARLLQALGYYADCDYPVKKVICDDCPQDPFGYGNAYRRSAENPSEVMARREFDAAMIEIGFSDTDAVAAVDGKEIEGWGFDEALTAAYISQDREQMLAREGLTLLMAILQHVDNRRSNQRLHCGIKAKTLAECPEDQRFMLVSDLGATLGAFKLPKALEDGGVDVPPSLSHFFWDHAPIWKNWAGPERSDCTVQVIAFDTIEPATLKTVQISEPGRKFLADLLAKLSDKQLEQLINYAKLGERETTKPMTDQIWASITKMQPWAAPFKYLPFSPINTKPISADSWLATLKKKLAKVRTQPCSRG
ncbi:MAG: hypothetical protein FJ146_10835 [Deltaproteobacteria bacterium]|nr:hypothetical protein [Deltaproteobacteria bacterium]